MTRMGKQRGLNQSQKKGRTNRNSDVNEEEEGVCAVYEDEKDCDTSLVSNQALETFIEQEKSIREKKLSVILSQGEDESQYFEDSEEESNYGECGGFGPGSDATLKNGKETSKRKIGAREKKQEKKAKKQARNIGKGGMCSTGTEKACCLIF